jgi:hypothetical protein
MQLQELDPDSLRAVSETSRYLRDTVRGTPGLNVARLTSHVGRTIRNSDDLEQALLEVEERERPEAHLLALASAFETVEYRYQPPVSVFRAGFRAGQSVDQMPHHLRFFVVATQAGASEAIQAGIMHLARRSPDAREADDIARLFRYLIRSPAASPESFKSGTAWEIARAVCAGYDGTGAPTRPWFFLNHLVAIVDELAGAEEGARFRERLTVLLPTG